MRCGQSARRLGVRRHDLAPAARPGLAPGGQVVAVDQLHHDAGALAEPDHLVDGDDVRMRQLRHRLRLANQSPARLAVVAGDQLDGDEAAQLRVVGRHHQAHAAEGDDVADRVATDLRADDALEPRLDRERGGRLEHRVAACGRGHGRSPVRPGVVRTRLWLLVAVRTRPVTHGPTLSPHRRWPGGPSSTRDVQCDTGRRAVSAGGRPGRARRRSSCSAGRPGSPCRPGSGFSHELMAGPRGPAMP